jgi:hypothetical protein
MNRYTLYWDITPTTDAEYMLTIPPFEVKVQGNRLALTASVDPKDERELRKQADQVARIWARSLTYEHEERHEVAYTGDLVIDPTGQRRLSATAQIIVKAVISPSDVRKVERKREAALARAADFTRRAILNSGLRDMLDHWYRYIADPDGRLHPLYDVLQVVERIYGGRKKAASALNMSEAELNDLGHISNDPTVLNGRHPGKSPGPHRIASEAEVATCERVAKAIIEKYASQVVI